MTDRIEAITYSHTPEIAKNTAAKINRLYHFITVTKDITTKAEYKTTMRSAGIEISQRATPINRKEIVKDNNDTIILFLSFDKVI